MAKPSDKLHFLQDLLIDEFTTRIRSGDATPSDLNAARQLLKDNGIHCAVEKDNPLEGLVESLPFLDNNDKVIAINEKL